MQPSSAVNSAYACAIVAAIVCGLALDRFGGAWGQPLVNAMAWLLFAVLLGRSTGTERVELTACLLFATAGEIFLALVWGVYDYRLGNLPLFVPPGHVLLYALGCWIARRMSLRVSHAIGAFAAGVVVLLAGLGHDVLSVPLTVLFLLALRYGPAPRLYATMFVLALAMEIYGTWLGNWTWRAQVPWLGWATLNPPFAAGAFYCMLDWLVGWVRKRRIARMERSAA